jgi:hypothetical protein
LKLAPLQRKRDRKIDENRERESKKNKKIIEKDRNKEIERVKVGKKTDREENNESCNL